MTFRRTATQDVELGGQFIREGDWVAIIYSSANRDEKVRPSGPVDILRSPNPHPVSAAADRTTVWATCRLFPAAGDLSELLHRAPLPCLGEPEYLTGNPCPRREVHALYAPEAHTPQAPHTLDRQPTVPTGEMTTATEDHGHEDPATPKTARAATAAVVPRPAPIPSSPTCARGTRRGAPAHSPGVWRSWTGWNGLLAEEEPAIAEAMAADLGRNAYDTWFGEIVGTKAEIDVARKNLKSAGCVRSVSRRH